jgi:glutamyl-tRNA synthetase
LLAVESSPFVSAASELVRNSLERMVDADSELRALLSYPLSETLRSDAAKTVVEDGFSEVAAAVVAAYENGDLTAAIESGGFKKWINGMGKEMGRKGKRLFMPVRVALTGRMQGPDVGEVLALLAKENGDVSESGAYVPLSERIAQLKGWLSEQ